jgi:predicted nucleotidyltransferase
VNVCGLIVEYNPFHNGHAYHIEQAKEVANADYMIAVMSGSFLQRGEPAIIDKFHRASAALAAGVDVVVELPYAFAVQSSDLFAKGSVHTLHELGVNHICFGSESGNIEVFSNAYHEFFKNQDYFQAHIKQALEEGLSFPEASRKAYETIGLTGSEIDLSKPNNILGFSYVRTILENNLPIEPLTIKRINSNYHDTEITSSIASATSIRKQIFEQQASISDLEFTMPPSTLSELEAYEHKAGILHNWEKYFSLLQYRVLTMSLEELASIHGVDEGIEHRIKKTVKQATSFYDWVEKIKTKRYTWTRIQRIFVHLLTNTKKSEIAYLTSFPSVPYVRLLGFTEKGREYLNTIKKDMNVPLYSKLSREIHPMLQVEERATNAYYSILSTIKRNALLRQEFIGPIHKS